MSPVPHGSLFSRFFNSFAKSKGKLTGQQCYRTYKMSNTVGAPFQVRIAPGKALPVKGKNPVAIILFHSLPKDL